MGVPGADDIMLNYQSTSFHDSHYVRQLLSLRPAPEFEAWLERMAITGERGRLLPAEKNHPLLQGSAERSGKDSNERAAIHFAGE